MAEFCLECLRELDGINYRKGEFVLSRELELCEGCGQWKRVVVVRSACPPLTVLVEWIEEAFFCIWRRGEDER